MIYTCQITADIEAASEEEALNYFESLLNRGKPGLDELETMHSLSWDAELSNDVDEPEYPFDPSDIEPETD